MMGILERGEIKLVNRVEQSTPTHYRGRLSIPGVGTRFTADYPDKEDAVAALVDLNREVYGRIELAPPITDVARSVANPAHSATIGDLTNF